MRNSRRNVIWSELPVELLRNIAKHLKYNPEHLQNFRSVCKKWRRATAIAALLPYDMGSETLFSSSVYLLRPPTPGPPWVVTSVEITKGKFRFCHPLSGEPLSNIPENFSLDWFRPRRLAVDYHMVDEKDKINISRALFCHDKVMLYFNDSIPSNVDDGSLLVLFRGGQLGGSPPIKPEYQYGTELPWFDISYGSLNKFDDIYCFKGVVYAIDRVGKLYKMCANQFAVLKTLVEKPVIKSDRVDKEWRKRLVGSLSTGELFLIRRYKDMVKVYKLCKLADKKAWSWVKVEGLGDDDPKVLFISKVYSFFVSAAEFPDFELANSIVFSNDAFRLYCKPVESKSGEGKIQIFRLGDGVDGNFIPISDIPGSHFDVFSPPSWVLQADSSPFPSHYKSDPEEDEMMEPAASSQDCADSKEHVLAPSCSPKSEPCEEQKTEVSSSTSVAVAQGKSISHLSDSHEKHKEAPDISEKKVSAAVSASEISSLLASINSELNIKFQGLESLDIKSDLLSTVETIWNKHGNLVGESTVRSKSMLVCALESLAKVIIILQNTTARTLTDSLAKELASILYDLQCVSLKVDWLVPFIERALMLYKSKPLIESIMAIDKAKAQADKEKREFLAHSAKVKQELEERRACLTAKIPISEPIDLDQCLGEGLF